MKVVWSIGIDLWMPQSKKRHHIIAPINDWDWNKPAILENAFREANSNQQTCLFLEIQVKGPATSATPLAIQSFLGGGRVSAIHYVFMWRGGGCCLESEPAPAEPKQGTCAHTHWVPVPGGSATQHRYRLAGSEHLQKWMRVSGVRVK